MIKDIRYTGHSARPSDYMSPDGELAAAVNLIHEDGALHPILPGQELYTLPDDYKIMFQHHMSAGDKNFILLSPENVLSWFAATEPVPPATWPITLDPSDITTLRSFGTATVYQINAVGNTLLALTSNGIYYFLWKNGTYVDLGNKIPELFMSFSLKQENYVESDRIDLYIIGGGGSIGPDDPKNCKINGVEFCNYYWMHAYFLTPYDVWNTSHTWVEPTDFQEEGEKIIYSDAIKSKVNTIISQSVTGKGKFCMPFFVRYAMRLYDETLVMHSAPILMLPTQISAHIHDNGNHDVNEKYGIKVGVNPCTLQYQLQQFSTTLFDNWKDIVKSVDIFISAPLWDYDQAGLAKRMLSGGYNRRSVATDLTPSSYTPLPRTGEGITDLHNNTFASIPQHDRESFVKSIEECTNFYFLKSFSIEELEGLTFTSQMSPRTDIVIPDDYLQSLTVREVMSDDYQSHDTLIAQHSYNYNARLNIASIKRNLFKGYNPWSAICYNNAADNAANVTAYVEIYDEGRTMVLKHDAVTEINSSYISWNLSPHGITWFYYPDIRAKRVVLKIGSTCYELPLKPHQLLNGAFYFNGLTGPSTTASEPTVTTDNTISLPNKMYTSDVNNPFFFPLLGINTVGTGEIMGIVAAVKPLSQGQAGQFPLYAFTTEGVWALTPDKEGKFITDTPATLDVCINPESITQTEDSVLFTTARGIMILTGNKTVCISEILDGKVAGPLEGLPTGHAATIISLAESKGLLAGSLNFVPFKTYVATAKLIYDYTHQRIILYNPSDSYNYAYVFSLESKSWGMMATNLVDGVNSYPNALAVDNNRHLIDLSVERTVDIVSTDTDATEDTSQDVETDSETPIGSTSQDSPIASPIGDPISTDGPGEPAQPGEPVVGGGGNSQGTESDDTTDVPGDATGDTEAIEVTTIDHIVPAVLVTRPLKLDLPEVLKTIDRVIQRGHLDIHYHTPIQSILYGSRDGFTWHMVKSSTDHQLRGFSGTPYKYFKIVLICTLYANESINGATISVTPRYTNRIR